MKVLALLLCLLFVAPVGAVQQSASAPNPATRPAREVVRVNGTRIMSDRLEAAVGQLIPMESFHGSVPADKMAALRQQALQRLVDDELEYQEAVRQRVTVSNRDVEAAWAQAEAPYGSRRFEEVLRQSGLSAAAVRAEIRRTLTIRSIVDREVTAKCGVSQEDAARYFAANPDRFVEPEKLHIFAITVGVDPSSNAEQWLAAKELAGVARAELEAGASFEDTALKYSTDSSKTTGGDMGLVHRGSLSSTFEQIAKQLPVGQFSDVVETLFGYHIIRVSEILPAQQKSFEDVSANVRKDLTATRCTERKEAWIAGLRANADVAVVAELQQ